jgi:hypothetical protein
VNKDKEQGPGSGCEIPPDSRDRIRADDGVDATLIRWMLAMTPAQRLDTLQSHVDAVLGIRDGSAET